MYMSIAIANFSFLPHSCLYNLTFVSLFFTLNLSAFATSSSFDITLLASLVITNLSNVCLFSLALRIHQGSFRQKRYNLSQDDLLTEDIFKKVDVHAKVFDWVGQSTDSKQKA